MDSSISLREGADPRGYSASRSPFRYGSRKEKGPGSFLARRPRVRQRPLEERAIAEAGGAVREAIAWKVLRPAAARV
jgi:hypothetical protein